MPMARARAGIGSWFEIFWNAAVWVYQKPTL